LVDQQSILALEDWDMKSIRYRFGGAPRTLDDCLDRSRREPPKTVRVELERCRFAGGPRLFIDLLGRFTWEFSDCTVRCEECCGSFDETDMKREPGRCLRLANARIRRRLEQMQELGLPVEAGQNDFRQILEKAG
jgi:hypothetical protein